MPNHLQRAFQEIDIAPLYFISTHGFYDMNKYATGTPMVTTVPPNTIVIETSPIGEYCFFTNILTILGPLLKDRSRLVKYLGGDSEEDPIIQKIILTALSSCQFYLPGGTIANRILEATGGIYRTSDKMESERTGDYGTMGFYKYTVGNEEPEKIFTERYSKLVEGAYGDVKGVGTQVNTSSIPFETFETMFQRINEFGDRFKIIFFSSCGEIRDTESSSIRQIQEIRGIQKSSFALWNDKIRVNYNKSRLALKHVEFKENNATKFGLTLTNGVPRKLTNFSELALPKLSMKLRSSKSTGGSRKFVKKSTSKHKIRRTRKIL